MRSIKLVALCALISAPAVQASACTYGSLDYQRCIYNELVGNSGGGGSITSRPNPVGGYDYSNGVTSRANPQGGYDYSNGTTCRRNPFGGLDCQ